MTIKQRFQLLNTLRFSLQNKGVLLAWQSHKINWSIIILDAVKVMNVPTIGKRFSMYSFPYIKMLRNIPIAVSFRMFWFKNFQITTRRNNLGLLPLGTVLFVQGCHRAFATLLGFIIYYFAAIYARMSRFHSPSFLTCLTFGRVIIFFRFGQKMYSPTSITQGSIYSIGYKLRPTIYTYQSMNHICIITRQSVRSQGQRG